MPVDLLRLRCGVTNYEWGKRGNNSVAARYAASALHGIKIEDDLPYAEFWMGTHATCPSHDFQSGRSLVDVLQNNRTSMLGPSVSSTYKGQLPFLLKVLSVGKTLSIQAHPDTNLAEKLHELNPQEYKDSNHKPEMAIALTPFESLCGFRPLQDVVFFARAIESFRALLGQEITARLEDASENRELSEEESTQEMRRAFDRIMHSSDRDIELACGRLMRQLESEGENFAKCPAFTPNDNVYANLLPRLNSQFPCDRGLFITFFLNYICLQPGEAIYLRANDIHAYISGDIIECMATSDNVVRAGFTRKSCDRGTLGQMLTYRSTQREEQKMTPTIYSRCKFNSIADPSSTAVVYDPPIEEFAVITTELAPSGSSVCFDAIEGPSIVICTGGVGTIKVGSKQEVMTEGTVVFVAASMYCELESSAEGPFVTFRAFCETSSDVKASS